MTDKIAYLYRILMWVNRKSARGCSGRRNKFVADSVRRCDVNMDVTS